MIVSGTEHGDAELNAHFRALLPGMSAAQIEALLETVAALTLDDLCEPQTGLIMLTAKDAFQASFHLGEILVSVAEVSFDGIRGHATVMGDDTRRAMLAALIHAVSRHPDAGSLLSAFRTCLERIAEDLQAARAQERALLAATRVHFDSMAPESM